VYLRLRNDVIVVCPLFATKGDRMLPIALGRPALRRRSFRHRNRQAQRKIRSHGHPGYHRRLPGTGHPITGT
jgi:hypothetical protein